MIDKNVYLQLIESYFSRQNIDVINLIDNLNINNDLKSVMRALCSLKYSKTISYSEFAKMCDFSTSVRYIATLIGKNPLPVVVPCHRVIRKNGDNGEYIFGRDIKERLILLEKGQIDDELLIDVKVLLGLS